MPFRASERLGATCAGARGGKAASGGAYLRQGGALHVFDGLQVAGQLLGRLRGDGLLLVLGQLLDGGGVVPQVDLCPHQQERGLWTVVSDFGYPLGRKEEGRSQNWGGRSSEWAMATIRRPRTSGFHNEHNYESSTFPLQEMAVCCTIH